MNLVALVGNVASAPESRTTPSGRIACRFRIAVSRPGGESAYFFTIVTWERQAEVCQEYLTVGRRIAVEGCLHHADTHEIDRSVEVVASRVELLGRMATAPQHRPEVAALIADAAAGDPGETGE